MANEFTVRVTFDRVPDIIDALDDAMDAVVRKTTLDAEGIAKQLCPVDTGALRASIQSRFPRKLTGEVTVGQHYGIYQEYGTVYMRAQPFIGPAVVQVEQPFRQAVGQVLEKLANG